MPGYDKSRFLNKDSKDLDEFICGICQAVFIDPVVTQCCQQTYCSDCIHEWLNNSNTCPNDRSTLAINDLLPPPRAFKNLLNNLLMTCENSDEGCPVKIKISEMDKHSIECEYRPNSLCKVCKVSRQRASTHNCLETLIMCKNRLLKERGELKLKLEKLKDHYLDHINNFSAKLMVESNLIASMQVS